MKKYEIMYILRSTLEENDRKAEVEKLAKLLTSNGKLVLEKEEKRTVIVQKNAEENEVINENIEEDKKQQIEEKIESQNLETNELTNNSETNMVTDLEKLE